MLIKCSPPPPDAFPRNLTVEPIAEPESTCVPCVVAQQGIPRRNKNKKKKHDSSRPKCIQRGYESIHGELVYWELLEVIPGKGKTIIILQMLKKKK